RSRTTRATGSGSPERRSATATRSSSAARWIGSTATRRGAARRSSSAPTCGSFPRSGRRASRSDSEMVLDEVPDDVRVAAERHLLEDSRAVGAHGLGAQRELGGDLLDAAAGTEHAEHLVLAVGERLVRLALAGAKSGHELLGGRAAQV